MDGINIINPTMSKAWVIEDGAMVFNPEKSIKFGRQAHDIVTDKKNLQILSFPLNGKFLKKGNSGLFWGVKEDPKFHSHISPDLKFRSLIMKDILMHS